MILRRFPFGLLVICTISGCWSIATETIKVAIPLTQDLSGYGSMAVHFDPGKPEFQEGLNILKPMAMDEIRAAGIVGTVSEVDSLSAEPTTDLLLNIVIHDYLKSNAGFWVRGGLADQAKIIMDVTLTDVKTQQPLTVGAVGAWTFDNESDERVCRRAAVNLRRFLRKEYGTEK